MGLSEQERKLLEQLERSLMADDPTFADSLRSGSSGMSGRVHRQRATVAGLGFVVGVGILVGCLQISPWLSVVGFVVMLASALVGVTSWQRVPDDGQEPAQPHDRTREQDFLNRLDQQWRQRRGGDGGTNPGE